MKKKKKKKKLIPLTQSKRYTDFIRGRDRALEEILAKYTRALNLIVEFLKEKSVEVAQTVLIHSHQGMISIKRERDLFDHRISPYFEMALTQASLLSSQLRKTTYAISYLGQAEALARALNQKTKYSLNQKDFRDLDEAPSVHGGRIDQRIELSFLRLKDKVSDAFRVSLVLGMKPNEAKKRIEKAFPRSQKKKTKGKVMAKLKESDANQTAFQSKGISLATGTVDPQEWDQVLKDYFSEVFPGEDPGRSAYDKVFYPYVENTDEENIQIYTRYQWEVENELTQDFVEKVREGELDAAKENGINDFQWIAIIDSKTDDCCIWRDGLTTKEIEDKLDQMDDECDDSSVPPIHFNCRCRLAPMTEDMPEESPPDFGSFDQWMENQGRE